MELTDFEIIREATISGDDCEVEKTERETDRGRRLKKAFYSLLGSWTTKVFKD